jgi:riboflavin synthase
MFTGLVADLGTVLERTPHPGGASLRIGTRLGSELRDGDSVAVNGVCLTAIAATDDAFAAEVVEETLRRSSLGSLEPGAPVNLELPLRASDRLGGHFVLGHADGTAAVVEADGSLVVELGPELLRYVVEKGSIALDGVSLTVAAVDERTVSVALIPETRRRTTLGAIRPGARLNVEVDVLAKHLEKLVGGRDE